MKLKSKLLTMLTVASSVVAIMASTASTTVHAQSMDQIVTSLNTSKSTSKMIDGRIDKSDDQSDDLSEEGKVNTEPVSDKLAKKLINDTTKADPITEDEVGNKTALAKNITSEKALNELGLTTDLDAFKQLVSDIKKQHKENLKDGTTEPTKVEEKSGKAQAMSTSVQAMAIGDPGVVVSELAGSFAGEKASMFNFKIDNDTFAAACCANKKNDFNLKQI